VNATAAIATFAATGWLIGAAAMAVAWMWQRRTRHRGLADAIWPLVTAGLSIFYANVADGAPTRQSAIAWMIGSWGVRLGVFLLWEDVFARQPDEHATESVWHFERRAIESVFFSLPALFASLDATPTLSIVQLVAAGIWLVGFAGETTADRQLARWRRAPAAAAVESRDAGTPSDALVCREGVWRYVPRAHDVFELITWTAHALFASTSPLGWVAAACPVAVAYRVVTRGTGRAQL
jgi:steroid 5-alpha reductase family enzyme